MIQGTTFSTMCFIAVDEQMIENYHADGRKKLKVIFLFDAPIGALNTCGLACGLTAIGLELVWYAITMFWKLTNFISGKRFDKMVRV